MALVIAPGQRGDAPIAIDVLSQAPPSRIPAADAAYGSSALLGHCTMPVIPNNTARRRPFRFDRTLYRRRNIIERGLLRRKDDRRFPTRDDKIAVADDTVICRVATAIRWL